MTKATDRDLVAQARGGDLDAFGELVRRHQPRLQRLVVHMLRDAAEAEDVTQEAFLRAHLALDRFDGRSEPYTWLYRIAVNLALNALRARKPERSAGSADDPRLEAVVAAVVPESGRDPHGAVDGRRLYTALCEGIDALSETLRTTLLLVCVDGRTHEEASAILGAPSGTIAWRVHEARRKLKEFLEARGYAPDGEMP